MISVEVGDADACPPVFELKLEVRRGEKLTTVDLKLEDQPVAKVPPKKLPSASPLAA